MGGVEVAVFLIHSIGEGTDWIARERTIAENIRRAGEQADVRRVVYLGGLGDDDADLSAYLPRRHEVDRCSRRARSRASSSAPPL